MKLAKYDQATVSRVLNDANASKEPQIEAEIDANASPHDDVAEKRRAKEPVREEHGMIIA